jgi:hypothetical protein
MQQLWREMLLLRVLSKDLRSHCDQLRENRENYLKPCFRGQSRPKSAMSMLLPTTRLGVAAMKFLFTGKKNRPVQKARGRFGANE